MKELPSVLLKLLRKWSSTYSGEHKPVNTILALMVVTFFPEKDFLRIKVPLRRANSNYMGRYHFSFLILINPRCNLSVIQDSNLNQLSWIPSFAIKYCLVHLCSPASCRLTDDQINTPPADFLNVLLHIPFISIQLFFIWVLWLLLGNSHKRYLNVNSKCSLDAFVLCYFPLSL